MACCAIHQPNFFPWMGYFNKIAKSDVFVFLNQVDYEKSGHSMQCYTNRVAILSGSGEKTYIHCPVQREHGPQPIDKVKIKVNEPWKRDLLDKIVECYKGAEYFDDTLSLIEKILSFETDSISEFNIQAIVYLSNVLKMGKQFVRQDELVTKKHSTELLVEITSAVECDSYMYGGGGAKYQEEKYFEESGIRAIPQNYIQSVYKQGNNEEFVPGLSILDSLFWNGVEKTRELIFN